MMEAARSPGAGMPGWAVSPPTSGIQCGIGCNINVNERGELVIKKVIPGGPAAFSCELGLDDVLVRVDGVSVEGDSTEEVAKRIVGPAGFPLSIVVRHLVPVTQPPPDGAVRTRVQLRTVESNVTLIRQPTVHIPERISEGNVGLGVEMLAMPNGERRVVKMQQGGTAQLSGKINIGDHVLKVPPQPTVQSVQDRSRGPRAATQPTEPLAKPEGSRETNALSTPDLASLT
ncbi:hypothetical protein T484DRAFT_2512035 [Baffinella frigidus]|nr:hypothetical protein T484DRAFT_2512035 [Cryptophyta sp. CCMP2293]